MIPQQLKKIEFRFIKVRDNKAPLENEWTTKNNYQYNSKTITSFIKDKKIYGVVTGFANLIVIDFDSKLLQDKIGDKLPKTFTVKTAGKGLHHLYYFCDKPESFKVLDINKETLADIQGPGKQVIGPGSKLSNGRSYEIINDIPIGYITMDQIKISFGKWLNIEKDIAMNTIETDLDCRYIKQLVKVSDVLRDLNINTDKTPTDCPFHSSKGGRCFSYNDDVWHCFHCEEKGNIFHLVMKYKNCSFIEAKAILAKRAGVELISDAKPEQINTDTLDDIRVRTLKDIFKDGIPEIKWRVENIVPERGTVIFGGTSGSFKTWTAMHLAQACASGTKFLGQFETKKCKVLYIDEENGDITIPNRFHKLRVGHNLMEEPFDNLLVSIFNNIKLDTENSPLITDMIDKYKPKLVIIDSMVRCMVGEEDKAKDVRRVFDNLKPIFEKYKDVSFVLLHHTTKNDTDSMQGLRGSGDFAAFSDVILMFKKNKSFTNIKIVKNRHIDLEELSGFAIRVDNTIEKNIRLVYVEQSKEEQGAINLCITDILAWLDEETLIQFRSGQTINEMKKLGHAKNTIYSSLHQMVKDKDITKVTRGVWKLNKVIQESLS